MAEITELSEPECLELLGKTAIGRVGVVVGVQPVVLPVNYAVHEGTVVFRVASDSGLAHAPMALAAFEIDQVDEDRKLGWSVLIQGQAHDVTESVDTTSEALRALSVSPWADGDHGKWISITPRVVSGRRIG